GDGARPPPPAASPTRRRDGHRARWRRTTSTTRKDAAPLRPRNSRPGQTAAPGAPCRCRVGRRGDRRDAVGRARAHRAGAAPRATGRRSRPKAYACCCTGRHGVSQQQSSRSWPRARVRAMRRSAQCLGAALLLISSACSSDDNYVLSGYGPVIISPVRSSLAAQMNFKDSSGAPHPQWVIAMSDTDDVCTKLATHPDYFQNPIESFDAAIVWVWPGNLGTYFVGQQDINGSTAGNEIL